MELSADDLWLETPVSRLGTDSDRAPDLVTVVRDLQPRLVEALAASRELGAPAHVLVVAPPGCRALDQVEAVLAAEPSREPDDVAVWPLVPGELEPPLLRIPRSRVDRLTGELETLRRQLVGLRDLARSGTGGGGAEGPEDLAEAAREAGARVERVTEAARRVVEEWRTASEVLAEDRPDLEDWLRRLEGELPERVAGPVDPESRSWHRPWLVRPIPDAPGSVVVREDRPSWSGLFGELPRRGAGKGREGLDRFVPGSLHRALGGTLLLDADRLVSAGLWGLLRRVLERGALALEDAEGGRQAGGLRPEPIPLGETRVVFVGGARTARYLRGTDPESRSIPITVELESRRARDPEGERLLGDCVRALAAREGLGRPEPPAISRMIEEAARHRGDARQVAVDFSRWAEILREADRLAGVAPSVPRRIGREHVERAIAVRRERFDGLRRRTLEQIQADVVRIETTGRREGQCNGILVLRPDGDAFGRPVRITARARAGKGDVVAIEREVKLSGSLHHKGVLILGSFLMGRYTRESASLSASVVFEQSYGSVDGDSASLAELVALLSAITGVPVRQDRAITGAVDQLGRTQAVGGIVQKVEGFFDLCDARGLDGQQGVVLPRDNVPQLMLASRVREAVAEDRFHLWAVETVDDAIEICTGRAPGVRGPDGRWPEGSFNRLVEERLTASPTRARRAAAAEKKTPPAAPTRPAGGPPTREGG